MTYLKTFLALLCLPLSVFPQSERPPRRRPIRPFVLFFTALNRVAPGVTPQVAKAFTRWIYESISKQVARREDTFMNYGYAPLDAPPIDLSPAEEPNRHSIQLYWAVVRAADLSGRDVLEVGSGRGGGCGFMAAHLHPASVTGLDFAERAITFCERHYRMERLRFVQGDAESLPFPSESFDAVVNVESSHGYQSVERFLSETHRVLRPGGFLLLADLRPTEAVDSLREQLGVAGFCIVEEELITAGVVRARELEADRNTSFIEHQVPRWLRGPFREFAAVPGSEQFRRLRDGRTEYVRFVLQKPAQPAS